MQLTSVLSLVTNNPLSITVVTMAILAPQNPEIPYIWVLTLNHWPQLTENHCELAPGLTTLCMGDTPLPISCTYK